MRPDAVSGFLKSSIELEGITYPILIPSPNQTTKTSGSVMAVTQSQLAAFDVYEGSAYQRSLQTLESGDKAWVYHQ